MAEIKPRAKGQTPFGKISNKNLKKLGKTLLERVASDADFRCSSSLGRSLGRRISFGQTKSVLPQL